MGSSSTAPPLAPIDCELKTVNNMSRAVESNSKSEISQGSSVVPRQRQHDYFSLLVVLAIFLFAWTCTGAHFMADTDVYTSAILTHDRGSLADDYHLTSSNLFWDFGHLLWRPLGWGLFFTSHRLIQGLNSSPHVEVIRALVTVSFLASIVGVAFFFHLARGLIEDRWAALLSTCLLIFSDAFLNYSHAGAPYPVGLACLVTGMYFSISASAKTSSWFRAGLAGFMFALSVLFWFPYIFVLPAAFAAPLVLHGCDRDRSQLTGLSIAVCAVIGLTAYTSAIALVGIQNSADLRAWILAAGHGQIQHWGLRAVARFGFSLPRSFINMGRDGMLLKRYLVHDPYAPERLVDLFRLSLWKVGLFYGSLTIMCIALLRSPRGRRLMVVFATAAFPIVLFSLFIFEAGSIERYLPLYPFMFLAWGYVLASRQAGLPAKVLMMSFCVATVIVNGNAMRRGTLQTVEDEGRERIRDLVPRLTPASLVLAVHEQDSLAEFCHDFPQDAMISERHWQYYDVLEINTARLATWREDLATRILSSWHDGGTVWIPLRFLHERPEPQWNWVEGDDPRVHWSDLPAFFSRMSLGPSVGGQDGFALLLDDSANEGILIALAENAKASKSSPASTVWVPFQAVANGELFAGYPRYSMGLARGNQF